MRALVADKRMDLRIGQVTTRPRSASGTRMPKWPAMPRMRSGSEYSACVSWLSVSTISLAFHNKANFRAVSFSHAPGCDVMKSSALSLQ